MTYDEAIGAARGQSELGVYARAVLGCLKPSPRLTASGWAEARRIVTSGPAAGGLYRMSRFPFWREIVDTASDPNVPQITVVMAASQTGKSTAMETICGYFVDHDPSDVLVVLPTEDATRAFSKERFGRMCADSPSLRGLFSRKRKHEDETVLVKRASTGALIVFASASSSMQIAARSIRALCCDELDKWPAATDDEGDSFAQAKQRTTTYGPRAKVYCFSSPKDAESSRIAALYAFSDRRQWLVPCPRCGTFQNLEWSQIRYKDANDELALDDTHMVCSHCGGRVEEHEKAGMVAQGYWSPTNPEGAHRGYHVSSLISPFVSWRALAEEWSSACAARDRGAQQAFWGLKLGLPWEELDERSITPEGLARNVHRYDAACPAGVLLVTVGVDVQGARLEASAWGWGVDKESWALDHRVFPGDSANLSSSGPWAALSTFLGGAWKRADGTSLPVACTFVDAGFRTTEVNTFARDQLRLMRSVFPSHGVGGPGRPIVERPKFNALRSPSFAIGVDGAKEVLFARLALDEPGPGFCHFPDADAFDAQYFKSLLSERRVWRHGKHVWIKGTRSNEALDTAIYALAAMEYLLTQHPGLLSAGGVSRTPPPRRRIISRGIE